MVFEVRQHGVPGWLAYPLETGNTIGSIAAGGAVAGLSIAGAPVLGVAAGVAAGGVVAYGVGDIGGAAKSAWHGITSLF